MATIDKIFGSMDLDKKYPLAKMNIGANTGSDIPRCYLILELIIVENLSCLELRNGGMSFQNL